MTIIQLSSIRRYHRLTFAFFLLIFCALPFQKRIKGVVNALSSSWIPSDLHLPGYFSKSVYFYLSDPLLLLFVGFFLFYFKISWRSFLWEGPSKLLSLLFLTAVVSIMLSKASSYPLQYVRLFQFSLGFLLFNTLVNLRYRFDLTQLVSYFAWVLLGLGIFEGGIATCQYFMQKGVGFAFLGEMSLTHFPFAAGGHPLYWGGPEGIDGMAFRASGTFSHPNILGAFLFSSLLSSYYLYLKHESLMIRRIVLCTLPLQTVALFTTFSRSAFLSIVLSSLVFFFILYKQIPVKRFISLLATAIFSCISCLILFWPALLSRGGVFNYNEVTRGADLERIGYLKMAFEMIQNNPFFGVGFNNFQLYSASCVESTSGHLFHSKVHNIYLLMASETGLIGGGLFVLFLLKILFPSMKKITAFSGVFKEKIFLLALFLGLLAIGGCDFFLLYVPAAVFLFFAVAALLYGISLRALGQR